MEELKQIIIIRTDIEMGKGKLVAQGSHASLMSYLEAAKAHNDIADEWLKQGEKKIVLKIDNETNMKRLYEAFKYKKIPCALVTDAGMTQLPPGTFTALGIGPWMNKELDPITSALKLL